MSNRRANTYLIKSGVEVDGKYPMGGRAVEHIPILTVSMEGVTTNDHRV